MLVALVLAAVAVAVDIVFEEPVVAADDAAENFPAELEAVAEAELSVTPLETVMPLDTAIVISLPPLPVMPPAIMSPPDWEDRAVSGVAVPAEHVVVEPVRSMVLLFGSPRQQMMSEWVPTMEPSQQ